MLRSQKKNSHCIALFLVSGMVPWKGHPLYLLCRVALEWSGCIGGLCACVVTARLRTSYLTSTPGFNRRKYCRVSRFLNQTRCLSLRGCFLGTVFGVKPDLFKRFRTNLREDAADQTRTDKYKSGFRTWSHFSVVIWYCVINRLLK